jgi:hypothetical protein
MASCKWCGKSGWLLRISANGMCDTCEATEIPVIVHQVRAIKEAQDLVESSKVFETRVGKCEEIVGNAEDLLPYEIKGITVVEPSAAELKSAYEAKREEMVMEHFRAETERLLARAGLLPTPQAMIAEATQALIKIDEARRDYGVEDPSLLESEQQVRHFIQATELSSCLQEARKDELKGNREGALERYREALFFLTTEGTDHELRRENAGEIEERIRQLQDERE